MSYDYRTGGRKLIPEDMDSFRDWKKHEDDKIMDAYRASGRPSPYGTMPAGTPEEKKRIAALNVCFQWFSLYIRQKDEYKVEPAVYKKSWSAANAWALYATTHPLPSKIPKLPPKTRWVDDYPT
jgi:hypothetical protein